jgi:ABC-type lipoprotein release transport system permease subunit
MILRLAFKNIVGNGWRSMINVLILTIVLIGMVWMQAMYYSWIKVTETQQKDWEYGKGMLRVSSYDPFDAFSWDKSYAPIPESFMQPIATSGAVPILLSPATIYPQGRMMPAIVKGIPTKQTLLKFPSDLLVTDNPVAIPAIIGTAMAKSSRLDTGDIFTLRIKDSSGAFNALDVQIVKIAAIPVPGMDIGTVWIDLKALQEIKGLPDMASFLILGDTRLSGQKVPGYRYIAPKEYFADLYQIRETERGQEFIMYGLLLFLAMIAVFDTQALAVFKRRREIGTLTALGMTKARIALLFTTEGILYMGFASICSAIMGFPLFWYFAVYGYRLPKGYDDFGMPGFSEPIYFSYPFPIIFGTLFIVFILTAFVSWLPTRKIASLKPTDALRGKVA